ncbi:MAG: efflux RND transporter permease subunit [Eubacterium sp.]|nr:efflux RND transporter permease subunit [Eubacterium sp.]
MPKFSVKKPFTIFVAVVIVLLLGAVSFTRMKTDLLPTFSIPYIVTVATYPGASPEKVEREIVEPLEAGLGTVNGVVNVTSTSSENYGMVMLEFEEDTDIDSAMVKLTTALDLISLPENAGKPMVIEMSMDMLPVLYASVDYEGKDIYELSDFIDETVIPELERQDGVASVNTVGLLEKSVEIRLNEEKVEDVNDRLAAHVDSSLADAKKEINDAKAELADAKSELESAQEDLDSQEQETANQLGDASKALDQAMATQAAYEANLSSLQTSKTALEAEKKAYEDADVQGNYDQVNEMLDSMQSDQMKAAAQMMGVDTDTFPTDVEDAANNPEKLDALKSAVKTMSEQSQAMAGMNPAMAEMAQNMAAMSQATDALTADSMKQLSDAVSRLPQIDTELANLNTEIQGAQAALDAVNKAVQEASDQYSAMEAGKILAASGFASGKAQIADGMNQITSGEEQLKEAEEAYKKGRDEALKNANLDQLLSLDTLSGLITAENFSMPAGYIYEGEDQYLLKVGDEYASVEELENNVLINMDGIGDVLLKDVADVTWIDNSGDAYASVNGKDAVLVSVSKISTAGTTEVSDTCKEAIEKLQEENDGLRIMNLMDQGDYINLIISQVLKNLLFGAILAIIVLALFLRAVKPTIVVAISIPLSVLLAVVAMYFSGISLNILSLSGLALGIGMLVDNSIVVIENIYRLRGLGVPAAKAAVQGAKQMAAPIAASTLTTICVFLPIVFTDGIVRQLFVDMALTITYSLLASLLVALSVVPAMSATMLKKTEPKPQRFMNKVYNVYEKVLRYFLKVKIIPIAIAVVLLVLCGYGATKTGLVLLPTMGGEQMSVSMTVNEDLDDEGAFRVADQAMEQMTAIKGVEYVGMMSGSNDAGADASSMLVNTGGTHNLVGYLLLDEETAKDNSPVADQLEQICEGLDLEDYSVSKSNMDFSAYMAQGLSVNIYGDDNDQLLAISEDVMGMVGEVKGFTNITNGQEDGDETIELTINKDEAMRCGLTVAQIFQELSSNLTTEKTATALTLDGKDYDVVIVNENDAVDVDGLMDYEFTTESTDEDGEKVEETHKLSEFATVERGKSLASIERENQKNYVTVSAEPEDGYNTTLLSRELQEKLDQYEAPDGYTIEIAGESEEINDAMQKLFFMIAMAIILVYLIMVAQFQSFMSPFIIIFTIPLAFTGGLLAIFITREEIAITAMMGFLMLAGIIVNNGIVFVDYVNQLRLDGMDKKEALVKTGRDRMRPILMTTLTTVLAMIVMVFSRDAAADMSRNMAVVVIGGLLYATLMTLFIVPVLYDLFFRRELKRINVDEDGEGGEPADGNEAAAIDAATDGASE